ncbi:GntR family transcriptional regulator [Cryobacterium sp. CG_9.6]|uniref:GntR family transcriptional regulator n=1 Tax=Cryobacterium sp. CG_9.6 TaxID=2760710 RepID=UPI0024751C74|nr:GntR family transcriptional regulator [Cryobacterium sp. CG_9.6]MDH6235682.1 DNA-binding GntR family transcriptional regulator [Cryobacterium sp. CG_9.6]
MGDVAQTGGQAAYELLRARILSGELAANATLREQALAQELGVSRTPVREALRRLDAAGLVAFVPNRGATVLAWSLEQMRETCVVRASLESRAAALAAERIQAVDLHLLALLIERMEPFVTATTDVEISTLGRLNAQFHRTIVSAAGSPQLLTLIQSVSRVPLMESMLRANGALYRARSNHQHRDILTALKSRDPLWAEAAMRSHALAARNTVLGGEEPGARRSASTEEQQAEGVTRVTD